MKSSNIGLARLSCFLLAFIPELCLGQTFREVRVGAHRFNSSALTVNEGDTVRWVWDHDFHDVVSGPVFNPDGAFRSPLLNRGATFEVLFDRALLRAHPRTGNQYRYYCEPHGAMGMTGSVTVTRVAKNYHAALQSWQVVPPTSSSASGNCSLQLNANETQLTWSCSHNLPQASSFSIRRGALGSTGTTVCTVNGANVQNATCAITPTDADSLVAGNLYVQAASTQFPLGALRGQISATGGSNLVRGQVLRQGGQGVADVRVSDGTRSALTDAQGSFALVGVPNGVYRLIASKAAYTIVPESNVSPLLVNGAPVNGRYFLATRTGGSGLLSPVKALWNGFLSMVNIVEIINKGTVSMPVRVSLYDIDGVLRHQQPLLIPASGQFDVIVNDLPGFRADSYGIISIEFDSQFASAIDGRMTNYRVAPGGQDYEFAFSVPFTAPRTGNSAVVFNTFQPSRNPADANLPVAQWLSLVNLDPVSAHNFVVKRYDQLGNLLRQDTFAIPANGRTDIEGGHIVPGPNTVGLHLIEPDQSTFPYMAQLYRYGSGLGSQYYFAFPLLARSGSGEIQYAPISTVDNAENWLELVNVLAQPVNVILQYFGPSGALLRQDTIRLAGREQRHFFAGVLLGAEETGSVHIIPDTSSSIIGQSMFYYRSQTTGSISAMFGSELRESIGLNFFGSYNLFINMTNSLRISNAKNGANPVSVTIFSDAGQPVQRNYLMQAHQTINLELADPQYGTRLNSYGQLAVESPETDSLLLEVIRTRKLPGSVEVDFALPTAVR